MQVFETAKQLVHDIPLMNILQYSCTDHMVQIRVHEFKYQVNIAVVVRFEHIEQFHNVLMAGKLLQEDDFSERALRICRILERIEYFFHRHHLLGLLIQCFPDNAIRLGVGAEGAPGNVSSTLSEPRASRHTFERQPLGPFARIFASPAGACAAHERVLRFLHRRLGLSSHGASEASLIRLRSLHVFVRVGAFPPPRTVFRAFRSRRTPLPSF